MSIHRSLLRSLIQGILLQFPDSRLSQMYSQVFQYTNVTSTPSTSSTSISDFSISHSSISGKSIFTIKALVLALLAQAPPAITPPIQLPSIPVSPIQASTIQLLLALTSLVTSTIQAYISGLVNHWLIYDMVNKSIQPNYLNQMMDDEFYFTACQYQKKKFKRQGFSYYKKKRIKEMDRME